MKYSTMLRELRKRSVKATAREFALSPATVSSLRRGGVPSVKTLQMLMLRFDVNEVTVTVKDLFPSADELKLMKE